MKIVFVNRYFTPDHSATSQILSDLVFYLAENGFGVHVVTSRQRYDDPKARLPKFETLKKARIHRVWGSRFGRLVLALRFLDYFTFYGSAYWKLMLLLKRGDIVVAMTDPPLMSVAAAEAAFWKRAKLINWVQDLFPETAEKLGVWPVRIFAPILKWLRNISLKTAAMNVVISHRMSKKLLSLGVEPAKILMIANWADGSHICPLSKSSNPLVREWGLEDRFIVAYSGNMGRAHEFETLLGAAEKLKEEKKILFLFIGGGSEKPKLELEFERRGLKNIMFKPYQSYAALSESLGAADLHVISLKVELEGSVVPSKFYGVLAAGRPAFYIGDPSSEIGTIVSKENCGYAVHSGNSEELAQKIRILAADKELAERMGANARIAFERSFDMRFRLEEWKKILK